MTLGLRERLLIPILVTIAVGLAASVLLSYLQATATVDNVVRTGMEREVRLWVERIDSWINDRRVDLATWSFDEAYRDALVETGYYGDSAKRGAARALADLRRGYPYYNQLVLADIEGRVVTSNQPSVTDGVSVRDRDYFQAAVSGSAVVSDVLVSRSTGRQVFVVAVPVSDGDKRIGALLGVIDLEAFSSGLVNRLRNEEGNTVLTDAKGKVLAQSFHGPARFDDISPHPFGRKILSQSSGTTVFAHRGVQSMAGFSQSEETGWYCIEVHSLDTMLAATRKTGVYQALVGLMVLVSVAVIVVSLFSRTISRRLKQMIKVIRRVESGDLSARVSGPCESDEIGVLTAAFDTMTARLKQSLDSLNEEVEVRRKAEQALAEHRDHLEQQVATRTAELSRSNEQLRENIAEREKAEAALQHAKDAAELANRAKSEFLANMSHEIRTPMTAILGFAELLADEGCDVRSGQERIDAGSTIRRNGEYLLGIINDILDISKIEAGELEVERIKYSPFDVVNEVVDLIRVRAEAKGLPLLVDYQGLIPEAVLTDPTRLRQILINLLGNAIKFTESGAVCLCVRYFKHNRNPKLCFDVIDTGLGMTEDQVRRLFKPFVQADNSTTRRFGGTGLGLAISQALAGKLGGEVSIVRTRPGEGTTFRAIVATGSLDNARMWDSTERGGARVPGPEKIGSPSAKDAPPDLNGVRVLLAEDGPDNQRLISFVLNRVGAEVTVAENGQAAIDKALAAADHDRPFDLILMDMQMPIKDGYEATVELRELGYLRPIVALTAHAMATDEQKCLSAGCDAFATKPIDRAKLISLVAALTAMQRNSCPQAAG